MKTSYTQLSFLALMVAMPGVSHSQSSEPQAPVSAAAPVNQATTTNSNTNQIQIQIQLPSNLAQDPFLDPRWNERGPVQAPQLQDIYQDLLQSCSDATSGLRTEQRLASMSAFEGQFGDAADSLQQALRTARQKLVDRVSRPLPNTLKALSGSLYIYGEISAALQPLSPRYDETRSMVSYLAADQLTSLVLQAYEDLDQRFYIEQFRHCRSCQDYRDWDFDAPISVGYFDGIRQLALRFLKLQNKIQEALATDFVELRAARASAVVAVRLLEQNPFRRSFCSSIRDLDSLIQLIDRFENPREFLSAAQKRSIVRQEIEDVVHRLSRLSHRDTCETYPERTYRTRR